MLAVSSEGDTELDRNHVPILLPIVASFRQADFGRFPNLFRIIGPSGRQIRSAMLLGIHHSLYTHPISRGVVSLSLVLPGDREYPETAVP
jgi:hypothetical protein